MSNAQSPAAVQAAENAETFEDLREALRDLHVSVGEPAYRALEATLRKESLESKNSRNYLSSSAMSAVFRKNSPISPSYSFVSKFTRACGADPEVVKVFEAAWSRIRSKAKRTGPTEEAAGQVIPGQRVNSTIGDSTSATQGRAEDDHLATLDHMAAIAHDLTGEHASHAARRIYEHIHRVLDRLVGQDDERTQRAAQNLANVLAELGDFDPAYRILASILAAYRDRHGDNHNVTLSAMDELAIVQIGRGNFDDAVQLAEASLAARRLKPEQGDELIRTAEILMCALERTGDQPAVERLRDEFDRQNTDMGETRPRSRRV